MIHHGDCLEVMSTMPDASVDAIVTDPPYGLEFMGKAWDKFSPVAQGSRSPATPDKSSQGSDSEGAQSKAVAAFSADGMGKGFRALPSYLGGLNPRCKTCGKSQRGGSPCRCERPNFTNEIRPRMVAFQEWNYLWAIEALRVAKPGAYLLAFGGTRTSHRLAVALEDAGWIIRDTLVWAYASGFPKGRANLKPAWEPIVMARKPGPLRHLAIDECRIPTDETLRQPGPNGGRTGPAWRAMEGREPTRAGEPSADRRYTDAGSTNIAASPGPRGGDPMGRWPANVILTDPIFDGGEEGVVGGGYQESTAAVGAWAPRGAFPIDNPTPTVYGDSGTYSRFFLIPKADRSDREPVVRGQVPEGKVAGRDRADGRQWDIPGSTVANGKRDRENVHPTVKPTELMRHLVRLVTPVGGTVLDPFLGSGTTGIAAEMEGFAWIGIEREAEYVAIAEARLNGTQRGLGLSA